MLRPGAHRHQYRGSRGVAVAQSPDRSDCDRRLRNRSGRKDDAMDSRQMHPLSPAAGGRAGRPESLPPNRATVKSGSPSPFVVRHHCSPFSASAIRSSSPRYETRRLSLNATNFLESASGRRGRSRRRPGGTIFRILARPCLSVRRVEYFLRDQDCRAIRLQTVLSPAGHHLESLGRPTVSQSCLRSFPTGSDCMPRHVSLSRLDWGADGAETEYGHRKGSEQARNATSFEVSILIQVIT
jgi:hypothetical protein